jgi:RHS repeat-associated protein
MTTPTSPPASDSNSQDTVGFTAPAISLPKGGGAVRGIGEKFGNNPVTGTATASVPVAVSAGRSGFAPSLALSYDSGNGNGPYGLGWSLNLAAIQRTTDRGLPTYRDDRDTFSLVGEEDLVVLRGADGLPLARRDIAQGYTVYRYRPRVESDYQRIERWVRDGDADTHWRTYSHDNVMTIYGKDTNSRIAESTANPVGQRVFAWLVSESRDSLGNAIQYMYKAENGVGADLGAAHQCHRGASDDPSRATNRYLKSVRYGNIRPLLEADTRARPVHLSANDLDQAGWLFELIADYGEHNDVAPSPADAGEWQYRSDAFSSYRAGFEVRTARLCRRFLMFHHITDVAGTARGYDGLVGSTDLGYSQSVQGYTFLRSVTQRGYDRQADGSYRQQSLPPVEYDYTEAVLVDRLRNVDAASTGDLPAGLLPTANFVDLRGDGVPGVLVIGETAWYYSANTTPAADDEVQFTPTRCLLATPNSTAPMFVDLAGDGTLDAATFDRPNPGFYAYETDLTWTQWKPFASMPCQDLTPTRSRFVDLTGDGLPDLLVTDDEARMVWYPSLGQNGFDTGQPTQQILDDETGPRLVFSDDVEGLHLADMSGDGLADLVRIGDAEVCYWPNLGYGRFGAKITMDMPAGPGIDAAFDHPEQFDPARIRLADIDGSGTVDIIYLRADGARVFLNRSGNELSAPTVLSSLAGVPDNAQVLATDLLGNGTACLVWLSENPSDRSQEIRYVDLMGVKPHLLQRITSNLGAETTITYSTSTRAALRDELAGRPWPTRLPFPVHVVARVDIRDAVTGNVFTESYAYHDGCYDGREREFRGFAMVERWDSEHHGPPNDEENPDADLSSLTPPLHTKTWFHTGMTAIADGRAGATALYWRPQHVENTTVTTGAPVDPFEATRALKGSMVREEVWGDGDAPYTVVEKGHTVEQVQAPCADGHGSYRRWCHDAITFHHEQRATDPRVEQSLTVAVDDHGIPLRTLRVGYGRRDMTLDAVELRDLNADEKNRQSTTLITYTDTTLTNPVDSAAPGAANPGYPLDYRHPQTAEQRRYQISGVAPPADGFFTAHALAGGLDAIPEIAFDQAPVPGQSQKRLVGKTRNVFRADRLDAVLPTAVQQPRGLRHEVLRLAFTGALVAEVYGNDVDAAVMTADGGYRQDPADGSWWIPSGQPYYSPNDADTVAQEFAYAAAHFFRPLRYRDPFGNETLVGFDEHDLLVTGVTDAVGNRVSVGQLRPDGTPDPLSGNDYRVLQPQTVSDANGNRTAVRFDPLGLVEASAVMGKPPPAIAEGDSLDAFQPFDDDALARFIADPVGQAGAALGGATSRLIYDLNAFQVSGQPASVYTVTRQRHGADPGALEVAVSYSDGFAREVQTRRRAAPGPVPRRDAAGHFLTDANGAPVLTAGDVDPRWTVSGWKVYDNKGNPVRQYEPFFSDTHQYEAPVELGVSSVLCYDPAQRVVAVIHPDHTWEKTLYAPWYQQNWDCSDTVAIPNPGADPDVGEYIGRLPAAAYLPTWQAQRAGGGLGAQEQRNAAEAVVHAGTPSTEHLDALGRAIVTVEDNRYARPGQPPVETLAVTRWQRDIDGNVTAVRAGADPAAPGRLTRTCRYNVAGAAIAEATLDDGTRLMLLDVAGRTLRERRGDALRRNRYDALGRPTEVWIDTAAGSRLAQRNTYGEAQGAADNHRGRLYQTDDGAGRLTIDRYDFKGNPLTRTRRLLNDYHGLVDWNAAPALEAAAYQDSIGYDAQNRPITSVTPDGTTQQRTFNVAGQLVVVTTTGPGAAAGTTVIAAVDYDAHGRRTGIDYGNGAHTDYTYDPATFRLTALRSTRPAPAQPTAIFVSPTVIQDLRYSYDASGNIVDIEDGAQATVVHDQQVVAPQCHYVYDARHRLIEAHGREHIGQNAFDAAPPPGARRDAPFAGRAAGVNDLGALRNFTQFYDFNNDDNLQAIRHVIAGGGWNRQFVYGEDSRLEPGAAQSDRVSRTVLGNGVAAIENYAYSAGGTDARGCITAINAMTLGWSFGDRLDSVDLGGGGVAYYSYNADGQRTRKVIDTVAGGRRMERLYLDGYEIYREYTPQGAVTSERHTVHVYDGTNRVALVETPGAAPDPTSIRFQLTDHLGTATVELDSVAALISYEECHPLGTTAFQVSTPIEVSVKRFRYVGKERDDETGLYYFGARYYLPWVGRWLSCDPARSDNTAKLYEYCRGNPIVLVDPNGREDLPAVVGKAPDCSTAKVHPKAYPSGPFRGGPSAREMYEDAKKKIVDGTLYVMSGGGVSSLEESKKNYDDFRADPSVGTQGKGTPLTNEIVKETPSASGELWLAWAGSAGGAKPSVAQTVTKGVGGAAKKSVLDILKDILKAQAGVRISMETAKDMLRATGRLISKVTKETLPENVQLLESEVEFVETPGLKNWASYGGTKADVVTWDSFKSPKTGKVRVEVDPAAFSSSKPTLAMQKMAHELYELQGLKQKLASTPGGMSREAVQKLIDELHTQAIKEEAKVLEDWIKVRKEAQGQ